MHKAFFILVFFLFCSSSRSQLPIEKARFSHIGTKEGLSQNTVYAIAQDDFGFIWIGTRNGLNRYDSRKLVTYRYSTTDTGTLSDNSVQSLLVDTRGRLWIGTTSGINLYNKELDKIIRVPLDRGHTEPSIQCVTEDKKGNIWLSTSKGIYCLGKQSTTNQFEYVFDAFQYSIDPKCNSVRSLMEDSHGDIWVSTAAGVLVFSPYAAKSVLQLKKYLQNVAKGLNDKDIRFVYEMENDIYWIGTKSGGINIYNSVTQSFTYLLQNPVHGLPSNDIRSLTKDRFGGYWIGTINGLSYYDKAKGFHTFTVVDFDPSSLSHNSIRPIFQDKRGTIWVGTYYGGVCVYDRNLPTFYTIEHSDKPNSINYNIISTITQDKSGNYWVGTEGGGVNVMNANGYVSKYFKHDDKDPTSLGHNNVKSMYIDQEQNLWIGTYKGGLDFLKKGENRFTHIKADGLATSLSNNNVYAIKEDSKGNLWIATYGGGLNVKRKGAALVFDKYQLDRKGQYHINSDNVKTLFIDSHDNVWMLSTAGLSVKAHDKINFDSSNIFSNEKDRNIGKNLNFIFEDDRHQLWFGTNDNGLCLYNSNTRVVTPINDSLGILGKSIYAIAQSAGKLWLSSNNGIGSYDLSSNAVKSYHLNNNGEYEFSTGAVFKSSDSLLLFGSFNGLTCFNPEALLTSSYVPSIVITDFKLFNKTIEPGDNQFLKKAIFLSKGIELNYQQNIFTIDFAVLNYILPENNKYAYKLEGFDNAWNYVDFPSATYTNLSPGTYTLLVKGANNDGIWNKVPTQLQIKILPPPWKTWWAYLAYIILFGLAIYTIIYITKARSKLKLRIKLEHLENERQKELNDVKLNFFTTVSHEFRTPLTLMLTPVEHLLNENKIGGEERTMLQIVKNNATRLLHLVTQLLDFRKQETGNLQLSFSEQSIFAFMDTMANAFTAYAKEQNVSFIYEKPEKDFNLWLDANQFEKVIFNVLSNAFKFVPKDGNGIVKLSIEERKIEKPEFPDGSAIIKIWDNGAGIPSDQRSSIFELYHHSNNLQNTQGIGIGLTLARNITELHSGKIDVESNDGDVQSSYSCFTIQIPLGNKHVKPEQQKDTNPIHEVLSTNIITVCEEPIEELDKTQLPTILVVEDNPEIRQMIVNILRNDYKMIDAENGAIGWAITQQDLPDIVITDIMMPETDGISLLKNIKQSTNTNHIPVVILTARTSLDDITEGLTYGVDDYLTKPFYPQVLALKIKNILAARERFRKKFAKDYLFALEDGAENNAENTFLRKVIQYLEENISEPELNVISLAKEMGMSRSVLYRKVKQMTGISIIELINTIRLRKSASLLIQNELNISQIAYETGFNDPKYFGKSFKSYFGKSPSEFSALDTEEQNKILMEHYSIKI